MASIAGRFQRRSSNNRPGCDWFHRLELVLKGLISSGDFGASPVLLCWRRPATSRVETRAGYLVRTMRFLPKSQEGPDQNNYSSPERPTPVRPRLHNLVENYQLW